MSNLPTSGQIQATNSFVAEWMASPIRTGDIVNGYTVTVSGDFYDLKCENDGWVYSAKFVDYPKVQDVFDKSFTRCECSDHEDGKGE